MLPFIALAMISLVFGAWCAGFFSGSIGIDSEAAAAGASAPAAAEPETLRTRIGVSGKGRSAQGGEWSQRDRELDELREQIAREDQEVEERNRRDEQREESERNLADHYTREVST